MHFRKLNKSSGISVLLMKSGIFLLTVCGNGKNDGYIIFYIERKSKNRVYSWKVRV